MVQQGDFKVSLVHADTNEAFKEHITKDDKVYVEVEPNEEYFIRVQRIGNAVSAPLLATVSVDDKGLRYHKTFKKGASQTFNFGLLTCTNGTSTHTALKFTSPRLAQGDGKQGSRLLMGKVEVNIYKGIVDGSTENASKFQSTWHESTIDPAQAGSLANKKGLRSGQGSTSFTKPSHNIRRYKKGPKVDVFTLNYCAAMGLIQVGVLPKPPVWVYHRMLHPASKNKRAAPAEDSTSSSITTITEIRRTKISRCNIQENELFDLSNLKDDDDE